MKVQELIKALEAMPPDAYVYHIWDGSARTEINIVYLSKSGAVMTADYGMEVYYTEYRPMEAPTSKEDPYWETPNNLNKAKE